MHYVLTFVDPSGCGGLLELNTGSSEPISLGHYQTGLMCTWLIKVRFVSFLLVCLFDCLLTSQWTKTT